MSKMSNEKEIKKIYEKSIRLLDNSQAQLRHIRQMLKKTVIRLSALHANDNKRISEILDAVTHSVNNKIDLNELDTLLDELFVLTNQDDYKKSIANNAFNNSFAKAIDSSAKSEAVAAYRSQLHKIVDKNAPDDVLAADVLSLFNEVATEAKNLKLVSDGQMESVRIFARNLSTTINCDVLSESESIDDILGGLSRELMPYLEQGRDDVNDEVSVMSSQDSEVNINQMLIEFVNHLSLHDDVKAKRKTLTKELSYPVVGFNAWKTIFSDMVEVINNSISVLDSEKHELQEFITKILQQLSDIEVYVQQVRDDSADTASQSARLNESVHNDVGEIQSSVADADDIDALKKDVEGHLSNIVKSVEENKKAIHEKEAQSKENFTYMMNELATTQRESERLKDQLEESHTQLLRDDLTGLPNRMALTERLGAEFQRWKRTSSPLCLAMWDIDHFKNFNDTYGHDVGDRVLKIVSNLIHTRIRKVDMFARYGGEEFVLLMPETELASALDLCNSLRVKLSEADFHYNGECCMITASVGIASFTDGDSIDEVMKRADIALYQSKDSGRNCCTASGLE